MLRAARMTHIAVLLATKRPRAQGDSGVSTFTSMPILGSHSRCFSGYKPFYHGYFMVCEDGWVGWLPCCPDLPGKGAEVRLLILQFRRIDARVGFDQLPSRT